jgi:anti-anti-sigma factor
MEACRLSVVTRRGRAVLILEGELDMAARNVVERVAGLVGDGKLAGFAMDLGGISCIDVAGLEAVVDIHRASGAAPPIHLVAASPPVKRLIGLLEIGDAFRIEPDL